MNNQIDFDFDDWQDLYKKDPKAFESRRQQVLEAAMAGVPGKQRVRAQRALADVELRSEGKNSRQRLEIATKAAVESMNELAKGLQALRQTNISR